MTKKNFGIGLVAVIVLSLVLAFCTMGLSGKINGGTKTPSLEGSWLESGTGVNVRFEADGTFQIMDGDAAIYKVDKKAQTVTLEYAQAYGGQTVAMTYTFSEDENTLTLVDTATGASYVYTRNQ